MEERSTGMSWIAVLFVIIVIFAIFCGVLRGAGSGVPVRQGRPRPQGEAGGLLPRHRQGGGAGLTVFGTVFTHPIITVSIRL